MRTQTQIARSPETIEQVPTTLERVGYGLGAVAAVACDIYIVASIAMQADTVKEGIARTLWQSLPITAIACFGAACTKNAIRGVFTTSDNSSRDVRT